MESTCVHLSSLSCSSTTLFAPAFQFLEVPRSSQLFVPSPSLSRSSLSFPLTARLQRSTVVGCPNCSFGFRSWLQCRRSRGVILSGKVLHKNIPHAFSYALHQSSNQLNDHLGGHTGGGNEYTELL